MRGGTRTGSERTKVRENRKRSDNVADRSPQPLNLRLLDAGGRRMIQARRGMVGRVCRPQ